MALFMLSDVNINSVIFDKTMNISAVYFKWRKKNNIVIYSLNDIN